METLSNLTAADVRAWPTADRSATRTTASAAHLGRPDGPAGRAIREVAVWLREWPDVAEMWAQADEVEVQRVAYWLMLLREALETKEAGQRDAHDEVADCGGAPCWCAAARGWSVAGRTDRLTRAGRVLMSVARLVARLLGR